MYLRSLVFFLGLTALPAVSHAELLRVALSTKDFGYLPLFVGIRSGMFAQENLDIQWIQVNSSVVVTALIAGEIDVAGIAGSSMRAAARGAMPSPAAIRHRTTRSRQPGTLRHGRLKSQSLETDGMVGLAAWSKTWSTAPLGTALNCAELRRTAHNCIHVLIGCP